jgi:hypothetical protein
VHQPGWGWQNARAYTPDSSIRLCRCPNSRPDQRHTQICSVQARKPGENPATLSSACAERRTQICSVQVRKPGETPATWACACANSLRRISFALAFGPAGSELPPSPVPLARDSVRFFWAPGTPEVLPAWGLDAGGLIEVTQVVPACPLVLPRAHVSSCHWPHVGRRHWPHYCRWQRVDRSRSCCPVTSLKQVRAGH